MRVHEFLARWRRRDRGYFVALEGVAGAGKTTMALELAAALRAAGRRVRTRAARPCATNRPASIVDAARDLRALSRRIRRDLDCGFDVVCERWDMSAWAYQLALGVRAPEIARAMIEWPTLVRPDLVIWLRVPPAVALERMDRSDLSLDFLEEAHARFQLWCDEAHVVDASRPIAAVRDAVLATLPARLSGALEPEARA